MKSKGFTVIEMLVVISIIGLLSNITTATVSDARKKARDNVKISELTQINKALKMFYNEYGRFPKNYLCNNSFIDLWFSATSPVGCPGNNKAFTAGACNAPTGGDNTGGGVSGTNYHDGEGLLAFNASMQELVDAGFLSAIPKVPSGAGYCYYLDYQGSYRGTTNGAEIAVVRTILESGIPSVTGIAGSNRYPGGETGWCSGALATSDLIPNLEYCKLTSNVLATPQF